jgi:hypothetical protein
MFVCNAVSFGPFAAMVSRFKIQKIRSKKVEGGKRQAVDEEAVNDTATSFGFPTCMHGSSPRYMRRHR